MNIAVCTAMILEIQQLELECVTFSSSVRWQQGRDPALLGDGCLSGRTTADYLCTRCAHESLRAKHAVTCASCAACSFWMAGHLALAVRNSLQPECRAGPLGVAEFACFM